MMTSQLKNSCRLCLPLSKHGTSASDAVAGCAASICRGTTLRALHRIEHKYSLSQR